MKEFWDKRYSEEEYVYGESPNEFFKKFIDSQHPGKILLPADGEGRNAVYASEKGWISHAFDFSTGAKNKALKLAELKKVVIDYQIMEYEKFLPNKDYYDVIAFIFTHLHISLRKEFFSKIIESIKPQGYIIMQVFSKEQIHLNSGGPRDIDMLFSIEELKQDFHNLEIIKLEEKEIFLSEGTYHNGKSSVIEGIWRKK
jgi:SAM-dependent methyltransferase